MTDTQNTPDALTVEDVDEVLAAVIPGEANLGGGRETKRMSKTKLEALKAAARRGIEGEWRPIETAPAKPLTDSPERILVWVANGGIDGKGDACFGYVYLGRSGKVARAEGHSGNWEITHWMPLPQPPTDTGEREEVYEWGHDFLGRCSKCLDNAYLDSKCDEPPEDCLVAFTRMSLIETGKVKPAPAPTGTEEDPRTKFIDKEIYDIPDTESGERLVERLKKLSGVPAALEAATELQKFQQEVRSLREYVAIKDGWADPSLYNFETEFAKTIAENQKLQQERDAAATLYNWALRKKKKAEAENTALKSRIEALEGALKQIVRYTGKDGEPGNDPAIGITARAALKGEG